VIFCVALNVLSFLSNYSIACKKFLSTLFTNSVNSVIILLLSFSNSVQQRGGGLLNMILSFLASVLASVVAYYLCKWLGR
jgi:hypothetical protein